MKWDLPPETPPTWLDIWKEIQNHEPKDQGGPAFIEECADYLFGLGCNPEQAFGVVANSLNETGWGRFYKANNLGGWKITEEYATLFKKEHGAGPPWWRAPGNKAEGATPDDLKGGDPPWCYYRVFATKGHYLKEWLQHFVPKPRDPAPYKRYRVTGILFWSQPGEAWFADMLKKGYKGPRGVNKPQPAIIEWESLRRSARIYWVQRKLNVSSDGIWGPKSMAACQAFMRQSGKNPVDQPNDEVCSTLRSVR